MKIIRNDCAADPYELKIHELIQGCVYRWVDKDNAVVFCIWAPEGEHKFVTLCDGEIWRIMNNTTSVTSRSWKFIELDTEVHVKGDL